MERVGLASATAMLVTACAADAGPILRLENLIAHYNIAYSPVDGICADPSTHNNTDGCESGCGNGVCSGPEACWNCETDCGSCINNGSCEPFETCATAPGDCGPCYGCGDGWCDVVGGETPDNCPSECFYE